MYGEYALLALVAALAGAINAIAGGGTLLTFPALFAVLGTTGGAAVAANATSTVALVPGAIAALAGYWQEIRRERRWAMLLLGPSLAGGLIGSLLLVFLPGDTFKAAVPWLILAAALLFALQPRIARWVGITPRTIGEGGDAAHAASKPIHPPRLLAGVIGFQLLVAVYGGYFGAGIGILMLAALALMGMHDIHRMNAVKTFLNLAINGTSVAVFATSGLVHWPYAAVMAVASSLGGYAAARFVKQLNKKLVRGLIVAIGFSLAAYYFYREFFAAST